MNSYWINSTKEKGAFNTLTEDTLCDVCIIGAGIFGLSTAYYLSKKGLNVIVLDKSEIGLKASGHTTAKITSQHGLIYNYLIHDFGIDTAKKYLDANEEAIKNIKHIINEEKFECDYVPQNNFIYSTSSEELTKIKDEIESLKSLGFNAQFINNLSVPFKKNGAIRFQNQAMFHPRKYMIGLCNSIQKNNGHIFTNTPVYVVKRNDDLYEIYTKNNILKSKYVVLASHYPIINFPGFYFTKMYQETSYIIGINTKSDVFDGMYINSTPPTFSYRWTTVKDKQILLLGGAGHKTGINNLSYSSPY